MSYWNPSQSSRNRDQNGAKTRKESAFLPKTGRRGTEEQANFAKPV
jgi:hypothetical protein